MPYQPWKAFARALRAVWANVLLGEFLRHRLATYLADKPQMQTPLPFLIAIKNGDIAKTANTEESAHPHAHLIVLAESESDEGGREGQLRWLTALDETEANATRREFIQTDQARAQVQTVRNDPGVEREYGERQPPSRHALPQIPPGKWKIRLAHALIATLIAGESWGISQPLFDISGVDMSQGIGSAFARAPLTVSTTLALAGGATYVLIALAHVSASWICELVAKAKPKTRKIAKVVGCAVAVLFLTALAVSAGLQRHGLSTAETLTTGSTPESDPGSGGWLFFVLLAIGVPIGSALILERLAPLKEEIRQARAARKIWLANQATSQALDAKLQGLDARCQQAEAKIRDEVETQSALATAYANSLLSALELDRYAFCFWATKLKRKHLLEPPPSGDDPDHDGDDWPSSTHPRDRAGLVPFVLTLGLAGSGLFSGGCQDDNPRPPQELAVHHHIVCSPDNCPADKRGQALERWQTRVTHLPGSTFTVWLSGTDRLAGRPVVVACVPETWGANVRQQKARFWQQVGQAVQAEIAPESHAVRFPPDCRTPASFVGDHSVEILAGDKTNPGKITLPAGTQPFNVGVVCDRSDSGRGHGCQSESVGLIYDHWLRQGGLTLGSTFLAYTVGRSRSSASLLLTTTALGQSPGQVATALMGARAELERALATPVEKAGSAIAQAVDVVSRRLKEAPGTYLLVVLSDLRQLTPKRHDFEKRIPAPKNFLRWLRYHRLLPDLTNVRVVACGLHHGSRPRPKSPAFKASHASRIEQVWQEVFSTAGSPSVVLLSSCLERLPAVLRTQ